jgi:hypothetical protein
MKRQVCLALVLTAAMVGTASAQEPPAGAAPAAAEPAPATAAAPAAAGGAFGQAGQIVLSTELDGSDLNGFHTDVSFIHTSRSMGGTSSNMFSLSPMGHYFVIPNVAVSAGLVIQHGDQPIGGQTVSATALGILVGAGYSLYLAPMFSIWPQLQIGYIHGSGSYMNVDVSTSQVPLLISVPVLWHPIEHFFVGLAPTFRTELSSSASVMGTSMDQSKQTDIGITAVIGGYFSM